MPFFCQFGFLRFALLVAVLLCLIRSAAAQAQACYLPNGNVSNDDSPCDTSGGDSLCCPGISSDLGASICLKNKLCFVPSQNALARGSCTDKTWKSDKCSNVCTNCKFLYAKSKTEIFQFIKLIPSRSYRSILPNYTMRLGRRGSELLL
jgi:hypothetical protein